MKRRRGQLDFFALLDEPPTPPSAEVLPFPADRMIGELRTSARDMLSMPPKQQRARIDFRSKLLWINLLRAGVPGDEIERQRRLYEAALTAELGRQQVKFYLFGDPDEIGGAG